MPMPSFVTHVGNLAVFLSQVPRRYGPRNSPYERSRSLATLQTFASADDRDLRRVLLPAVNLLNGAAVIPWLEAVTGGTLVRVGKAVKVIADDQLGDLDLSGIVDALVEAVGVLALDTDGDTDLAHTHRDDFVVLYRHQHDDQCAEEPTHSDRDDLRAYFAESVAALWRTLPKYSPPPKQRERTGPAMTSTERSRITRARQAEDARESARWHLRRVLDAGGDPASYSEAIAAIGEAIEWLEESQGDWDRYRAELAEYRVELDRLKRLPYWAPESEEPLVPPTAPESWEIIAEAKDLPLRPRVPSREVFAEVFAEMTGRPLPEPVVRTSAEILSRWIGGLPTGRHSLGDVWKAWQAVVAKSAKVRKREVGKLGRTGFYALLAEVGTVVSGGHRTRFLVIEAPVEAETERLAASTNVHRLRLDAERTTTTATAEVGTTTREVASHATR